MRSAEVFSEGSCRVMCYMEPNCVSIYIGLVEGGNQQCELNNATEKNQTPFLLVNKEGYTYLEIENPCSSSPCLNNGTCQARFTNKGFRCVCRHGFSGDNCQFKAKHTEPGGIAVVIPPT
ncbi:unnamed protein product [Pocillopora meandrina]|uniref:EGF-like domain-containing protein n=1 Tax=Pocillopora meandrina TaxID=46732 RepID=A0AAU9W1I0_9CNID|nr:unnamed protein product [Pocillopora meandrina]